MYRILTLLALVAAAPASAAPASPASASTPPASAAPASAAPASAAPHTPDDDFRAAAKKYAAGHGRFVAAWGTLRLDGKHPLHFAELQVPYGEDLTPVPNSARCGAYILEEAPGRYWLVTFWWFNAGFHAKATMPDGKDPEWEVLDDTELDHMHMHNHGKAHVHIGFRGGKLVVLYDEDYNSRRDPDEVTRDFTNADGTCRKSGCPVLATYEIAGTTMGVSKPAKTIAELVEPPHLM